MNMTYIIYEILKLEADVSAQLKVTGLMLLSAKSAPWIMEWEFFRFCFFK